MVMDIIDSYSDSSYWQTKSFADKVFYVKDLLTMRVTYFSSTSIVYRI